MEFLEDNILLSKERAESENIILQEPSYKNISEIDTNVKEVPEGTTSIEHNKLNISEDELTNFESFERSMKLGIIGRASTIQDMYSVKPLDILCPKKCNTFFPISRSYSEQQDDEIDSKYSNNYINNKKSQYTYVHGEKNDAIDKHKSKERDKVSNSLPSFLDQSGTHNSLPKNDNSLSYRRHKNVILRGNSYQSDSSHCSSVDSLLDSRKPDPEAILINLGFGPIESEDILSKIPKRFLQPSQVRGIDTEAFLRRQQMANNIHDHTVLGYRGLVGNPDIPPSTIVAKIMARFELNERNRSVSDINMNRPQSAPPNSLDTHKS